MIDQLKPLLKKLTVFAKMNLKFERPPRLFLKRDSDNATSFLGKTAHYDPQNNAITLFISGRHPKDILRSFTHELVHHCQNERGDLAPEKMKSMTSGYAQECPHMRKMEQEAYLQGNMCFRDWEDGLDDKLQYKMQIAEQKFLKENKNMSVKISKKELKGLIEKLLESRLSEQSKCKPKKLKNGKMETQGQANKRCNAADKARVQAQEDSDRKAEEAAMDKEHSDNKSELEKSFAKSRTSLEEEQVVEDCGGEHDAPGKRACGKRDCPTCGKVKMVNPSELSPVKEKEEKLEESKIQTPEQENTLYESRFTKKNTRLYEKLLKEWTK
jgi:hypothetical protein